MKFFFPTMMYSSNIHIHVSTALWHMRWYDFFFLYPLDGYFVVAVCKICLLHWFLWYPNKHFICKFVCNSRITLMTGTTKVIIESRISNEGIKVENNDHNATIAPSHKPPSPHPPPSIHWLNKVTNNRVRVFFVVVVLLSMRPKSY